MRQPDDLSRMDPRWRRVPPPRARTGRAGTLARHAALLVSMLLVMGAGDPALVKSRQAEKKYRKGDLDGALKLFEEARAARPGTSALDYNVGVVKYRKGNPQEAQREFSTALGAGESRLRASSYYNLGNCLFDNKDYDGAAKAYRKSLEIVPSDADAKHNLELALRRKEEQAQQQKQQSKDQKQQDQQQNQNQQPQNQQQQQQQQNKDQNRQEQDRNRQQNQGDSSRAPEPKPESGQEQPAGNEKDEKGGNPPPAMLDPNAMKPEDAKRLLDALRQEEERALEARREQNAQEAGVSRDW